MMLDGFDEKNLPKRKVCANCKNTYIESDKYCRYCGAPMGKPEFIPDIMEASGMMVGTMPSL